MGPNIMVQHFRHTGFGHNLPVLLALADIWDINILGLKDHTMLPYYDLLNGLLKLLPYYLSQLEMESR